MVAKVLAYFPTLKHILVVKDKRNANMTDGLGTYRVCSPRKKCYSTLILRKVEC